ncbi:MAG TPA: hypothetical protein DDW42_05150 [Desulfobacteraceae bacterium]|nr:hypothetical protein [Desulfobacteraceae bacterium]
MTEEYKKCMVKVSRKTISSKRIIEGASFKTFNFEVCAYLLKVKEGENFNHRNMLNISRIKI